MIISEMRLYWSSSAIALNAVHGAKAEQMNYITTKKGIGFIDGRTDKENKMKQETLEKIVEWAEGFEWENGQVNDPANFMYTPDNLSPEYRKDMWQLVDYPLLLRRAVEGWNRKNGPYLIHILSDNVECFGGNGFRIISNYSAYPANDYLTPQEQAIEACLIKLLENK